MASSVAQHDAPAVIRYRSFADAQSARAAAMDANAMRGSQPPTSDRATQAWSLDSASSSTATSGRAARARNTAVTAFAGSEW